MTTTTTATILWNFHREFVRAQAVTRNRTRPGPVNITRKEYRESYVFPQRRVYLFTRTGGNGRKPVFTSAPKRQPPSSLPWRTFFLFASAATNTRVRERTRRGIANFGDGKIRKRNARVSRRVRCPPPRTLRSEMRFFDLNGRFSRFRHVDRHTTLPHRAGALPSNQSKLSGV